MHESADIWIRSLQYLVDARDGKAKQAVDGSGGLTDAHTVYCDPRLAAFWEEEIQRLDAITRKSLPLDSTAAQDGPQNRIGSEPAIAAEDAMVNAG